MATVINLPIMTDDSGSLSVIEKLLPFEIKRIYYMYNVTSERGGHRHKKSIQALVCLGGSCEVYINNGESEETVLLDKPNKCLVLETRDWHTMNNFSASATLLVLASDYYDINDYIDEKY